MKKLIILSLLIAVNATAAQFTKYTGTVYGAVGSLTTNLDTILVNGAGWGITYSNLNKRVYRPAAGNRFYFRVDDNGTGTGGGKEALVRGAESWSDIDTPVGPFPTTNQSALTSNSFVFRKSADTNTARTLMVFADDRTAIVFGKAEGSTFWTGPLYIGDFYSNVSSDGFRTGIFAKGAENSAATTAEWYNTPIAQVSSTVSVNHRSIARSYLGVGSAINVNALYDYKLTTTGFQGTLTMPNAADGGVYLTRVHLQEYTGSAIVYRGRLRGLWVWGMATQPFADGDTLTGTGELAGKTFIIVTPMHTSPTANTICIETSNTLETN